MSIHSALPSKVVTLLIAVFLAATLLSAGWPGLMVKPSQLPQRSPVARSLSLPAGAGRFVAPAGPSLRLNIGLFLKGRHDNEIPSLILAQANRHSSYYHRWLTPAQYGQYFGADPAAIASTVRFLQAHGFTITWISIGHRFIHAVAPAQAVENIFDTPIDYRANGRRAYLANRLEPRIPMQLSVVEAVGGLDTFYSVKPHVRPHPLATTLPGQFAMGPKDLYTAYDFPVLDTGSGFSIALELTRQPLQSDMNKFSQTYSLPAVVLNEKFLNGTCPVPCPEPTSSDDPLESAVDSEWAHAAAPDAAIDTISVGDRLLTSQMLGFEYIVNVLGNSAQFVSTSSGDCESLFPPYLRDGISALANQGILEGQTWVAAAGDEGADDCHDPALNLKATVDLPASIPDVLAVGGTTANFPKSLGNVTGYGPEVVWNDSACASPPPSSPELGATGGGQSRLFAKPSWQTGVTLPDTVRDVPDVALLSDPYNHFTFPTANCSQVAGYWVQLAGNWGHAGGTSVAASIWSGILADLAQKLKGRLGLVSPELYHLRNTSAFHQITLGNNTFNHITGFSAMSGYSAVTGLGTPDVFQLLSLYAGTVSPTPRATSFPSPAPHPTKTPSAKPTSRAFVLNGNLDADPTKVKGEVLIFDATVGVTQGKVLDTIFGLPNPTAVVFNSTGSTAYILESGGTIDTVNPLTFSITLGALTSGGTRPSSVTLKGTNLYVADTLAKKVFIRPVGATTPAPSPIPVGNNPVSIIANPTSNFIYVANAADNKVSIIGTTTNKVTQTISVGNDPVSLAVSPDGKTLLVANQGAGTLSVIDVSVSPAVVKSTVFVGGQPSAIAVNSASNLAYVTNYFCPTTTSVCNPDGKTQNGVVELVSFAATPRVVQCCIVVGQLPGAIAFEPTGRYLWVLNTGSLSVSIIDSQTNAIFDTVKNTATAPHSNGQFVHAVP